MRNMRKKKEADPKYTWWSRLADPVNAAGDEESVCDAEPELFEMLLPVAIGAIVEVPEPIAAAVAAPTVVSDAGIDRVTPAVLQSFSVKAMVSRTLSATCASQ